MPKTKLTAREKLRQEHERAKSLADRSRQLMKKALIGMEPWCLHDVRRSFVTHCNELSLAPPHIIEAAVNHIGSAKAGVAGVYNRASWLPERRQLLEAWSAYVASLVGPGPSPGSGPA